MYIYSIQISTSVWETMSVMKWPVVQTLREVISVNAHQDIVGMAVNVQVRERIQYIVLIQTNFFLNTPKICRI